MERGELVDHITTEINRVFGPAGFHGSDAEYAWLNTHYGVSEVDDVKWQEICEFECGELDEDMYDEDELAELFEFLNDDDAVATFLNELLQRYKSGSMVYVPS